MPIAKVTSFFGGFLYLVVFALVLLFGQTIGQAFSHNFGIKNTALLPLILASAFLFSAINFCFSYFLNWEESYHEELDNAFFLSLQILIIPAIFFVGFIVLFSTFR